MESATKVRSGDRVVENVRAETKKSAATANCEIGLELVEAAGVEPAEI
jgi:hypothetical protein